MSSGVLKYIGGVCIVAGRNAADKRSAAEFY